jgi:hypothetical protein
MVSLVKENGIKAGNGGVEGRGERAMITRSRIGLVNA